MLNNNDTKMDDTSSLPLVYGNKAKPDPDTGTAMLQRRYNLESVQ